MNPLPTGLQESCAFSLALGCCGWSEEKTFRQEGAAPPGGREGDGDLNFFVQRKKFNLGFPHPEGVRTW